MRALVLAAMAFVALTHSTHASSSVAAAPHLTGGAVVVPIKDSKNSFTGSAWVTPSKRQSTKAPTPKANEPTTDKCHLVSGALYCKNGTGGKCYLFGGELFCN